MDRGERLARNRAPTVRRFQVRRRLEPLDAAPGRTAGTPRGRRRRQASAVAGGQVCGCRDETPQNKTLDTSRRKAAANRFGRDFLVNKRDLSPRLRNAAAPAVGPAVRREHLRLPRRCNRATLPELSHDSLDHQGLELEFSHELLPAFHSGVN